MLPLPIDEHLPAIVAALQRHSCTVLCAEPGRVKRREFHRRCSMRVWPAIDKSYCSNLGGLPPARLRRDFSRARHRLGKFAGYEVRFDRRAGRDTRILAVTDGVFVRMLADDPLLERIGIVIFDEFHERTLNTDLALAMVRRVQQEVRPDLKLLAMSATLAAQPLAQLLDDCPIIASEGRLFPVEINHVEPCFGRADPHSGGDGSKGNPVKQQR